MASSFNSKKVTVDLLLRISVEDVLVAGMCMPVVINKHVT